MQVSETLVIVLGVIAVVFLLRNKKHLRAKGPRFDFYAGDEQDGGFDAGDEPDGENDETQVSPRTDPGGLEDVELSLSSLLT